MTAVLRQRGESAETLVLSVPVSARRDKTAAALGNQVGAMLVPVSTQADPINRLAAIAQTTRERRLTVARGASADLLGPAFRILARLGLFHWFVDHQRLVTTFVTNLHGPQSPVSFLGSAVTAIIPITSITGNVTLSFAALSYAGTLTVTAIADPEHCPDLTLLVGELQSELTHLTAGAHRSGLVVQIPKRWGCRGIQGWVHAVLRRSLVSDPDLHVIKIAQHRS